MKSNRNGGVNGGRYRAVFYHHRRFPGRGGEWTGNGGVSLFFPVSATTTLCTLYFKALDREVLNMQLIGHVCFLHASLLRNSVVKVKAGVRLRVIFS